MFCKLTLQSIEKNYLRFREEPYLLFPRSQFYGRLRTNQVWIIKMDDRTGEVLYARLPQQGLRYQVGLALWRLFKFSH